MDILKQTVGSMFGGSGGILRQVPQHSAQGNQSYSRVPEWLKTVGETVGYTGETVGNLVNNLAGPAMTLAKFL